MAYILGKVTPEAIAKAIGFKGLSREGIDLDTSKASNYEQLGILDPLALKISIFKIVKELVSQVLKIKLILHRLGSELRELISLILVLS